MQAVRGTPEWAIRICPQVSLHGMRWSTEFKWAGGVEPPAAKEWLTALLIVCLTGLDSSITWRIAYKSSFAEMTGKSRNSKQERAMVACSDLERDCRIQKEEASGISSSQHRLSSSSIYFRTRG